MAKKELKQITAEIQGLTPKVKREATGKPFVKGQSGNPKGKPVGARSFHTVFQEAIKRIINKETGLPITEDDVVYKYLTTALGGDKQLLDKLIDRIYGKATDNLKMEGELVVETITGMRIVKESNNKKK